MVEMYYGRCSSAMMQGWFNLLSDVRLRKILKGQGEILIVTIQISLFDNLPIPIN